VVETVGVAGRVALGSKYATTAFDTFLDFLSIGYVSFDQARRAYLATAELCLVDLSGGWVIASFRFHYIAFGYARLVDAFRRETFDILRRKIVRWVCWLTGRRLSGKISSASVGSLGRG
jgi:hypothetical protein